MSKAKERSDILTLESPIESWDEAVPLGNGLLGLLLWKGEKFIQISLDRADLWDSRVPEPFTKKNWNWKNLLTLVRRKKWEEIAERYIRPGLKFPYPTKLPAGRLFVDLPAHCSVTRFELDRSRALGAARWPGGAMEAFCEADGNGVCIRYRGKGVAWRLEPPPYARVENRSQSGMAFSVALESLGYPAAKEWDDGAVSGFVQETAADGAFAVAVAQRESHGWTELFVAVERGENAGSALRRAGESATAAARRTWAGILDGHQETWRKLNRRSSVRLPDPELMEHYRQVSYFLGSVSRSDGPPISLQSIWTADDGALPPWKGDYHHNLNTQLSYWPHLTAGHEDRMFGFLDFMKKLEPVHRDLAKRFFGCEGIFVPGAMALDGQLIGGYAQVSYSPTNGAWVAQMFHQYWKYTLDRKFLKTHAYPYCEGTATLLASLLQKGKDGKLRLPLSASPEIHEGAPEGWVTPNSNYDLALMRWNFAAVAEMAEVLGRDGKKWRRLLGQLEPLAVASETCDETPADGTGPYLIAPGKPLHESHRHHSHLLSIYPLGTVSLEDGPRERAAILQSFRQIDKLGTGLWTGYSFAWMACLAARCGQPERARRALRDFVGAFISRNGFHLNGDFKRQGLSWWNYRPFTLEGNFAFLEGVHEMLLQSWRGVVRIFPAVPKDWAAASFEGLRTEGALVVSAQSAKCATQWVRIQALKKRQVRVLDPFDGKGRWSHRVKHDRGQLVVNLDAGEVLEGRR